MQLDRKGIEKILAASDDQLLSVIRTIAAMTGAPLPQSICHEDLEKIRAALSGATSADLNTAKELLSRMGK